MRGREGRKLEKNSQQLHDSFVLSRMYKERETLLRKGTKLKLEF